MDGSSMSRHDPQDCPQCGTAWRLKHGLCVGCLLACGLDDEMHEGQTLGDALDQIDMGDVD
jgi:predicted  nucleic acid-binding Zn ribbon protein